MNNHTIEDDRLIKDGEVIRVPMTLMDGRTIDNIISQARQQQTPATARSRYGQFTDAQKAARFALYDTHDKALSEAWKDVAPLPPELMDDASPAIEPRANTPSIEELYRRRDARLRDAWKGAAA
jgi:hypothetical protein